MPAGASKPSQVTASNPGTPDSATVGKSACSGERTKLVTASGQFLDQPAAAADHANYFRALPALKQSDAPPLGFETKVPVGGEVDGLLIVGYPVDKAAFDARQSLEVNIGLYGQKPLLLKK